MLQAIGVLGIIALLFIAWLISSDRSAFPWRIVLWALGLQFIFAVFVLNIPAGTVLFEWLGERINDFLSFATVGATFIFGNLADSAYFSTFGFVFAFTVLPTIVFFSAFMAVMYHLGLMQRIVYAMAWVMKKTMKTSGVESLAAASNVFFGQSEAVLVVKPYIKTASLSELNAMMVGGFVTVSGAMMAGYIQLGIDPSALITASILSAPAGLMMAKVVLPSDKKLAQVEDIPLNASATKASNIVEATVNGSLEGAKLAFNVGVMLLSFIALIALVDAGLGQLSSGLSYFGFDGFPTSLKELFGYIFQPLALAIGIPIEESRHFGGLLGTKVSLNEFLAYADLAQYSKDQVLSVRTQTIATFALCGFANFGSIAIQIGGIGAIAPERRAELAKLGIKAMFTGLLANLLTAAIVSVLLP